MAPNISKETFTSIMDLLTDSYQANKCCALTLKKPTSFMTNQKTTEPWFLTFPENMRIKTHTKF